MASLSSLRLSFSAMSIRNVAILSLSLNDWDVYDMSLMTRCFSSRMLLLLARCGLEQLSLLFSSNCTFSWLLELVLVWVPHASFLAVGGAGVRSVAE